MLDVAAMDRTADDLGWPTLVEHWATRCATARGGAAVRAAGLFTEPAAARDRLAVIAEARRLTSDGVGLALAGIEDVAAAIGRTRKAAALVAAELVAVARTGAALARVRAHLRKHAAAAPGLAVIAGDIADLGHVYHPILEAFDGDGRLVDHASPALGSLRKAVAALTQQLDRRMDELVKDPRYAPLLQDDFYTQRDERYVLPIRTDGKGFVKGIVHGTSQSGQTIFIEPEEIVDLNNRKRLAECEVADEERRIFIRLSGWVAEEADGFELALAAAERLDVVASAALLADDLVAAAPIIDDAPRIALLHARHPLMLLAGRRCVANDVTVAAGGTLLVSGPNAGGKTVALKTTGLCALMTRAGLHLPAESGSAMGWFTEVRSDIGDAQSLEANLSTFTGHVAELRSYLEGCGPGTLLLVDEIAVGTDPDQGAALAQAVLEALAERGVTAIVTTHYERLKALGATDDRFANASVGFDLERLEPTFKLHLGTPGSSGALVVARRMGLPGAVVDRAAVLLGDGGVSVDGLLRNVAEQRRRLEEERAAGLAELEALESERMALRNEREQRRAASDREQGKLHGEALAALRQARQEVDLVRAELRRKAAEARADAEAVRIARRTLVEVGASVARLQPRAAQVPGRAPRIGELVPGAPVLVPSLGGRGELATAPERGKAVVRLGGMHATVDVADILIDSHRSARRAAGLPDERDAGAERDGASAAGDRGGRPADRGGRGDRAGRGGRGDDRAGRADDRGRRGDEAASAAATDVALVDGNATGRAPGRTSSTTLDVRGQRVDEAITNVERFLDESLLLGHDAVFIVHGHGTGALRAGLRARLAAGLPAVKLARPGEPNEGGDGVTVILLRD